MDVQMPETPLRGVNEITSCNFHSKAATDVMPIFRAYFKPMLDFQQSRYNERAYNDMKLRILDPFDPFTLEKLGEQFRGLKDTVLQGSSCLISILS